MTNVTHHVQHHFCAFRGTSGTDYWLLVMILTLYTWGAARGAVYNRKGAWQLRG